MGAVIEGFATCLCQLVGKAIADVQPKHGDVVGSFIGTALVVAGMFYTTFSGGPSSQKCRFWPHKSEDTSGSRMGLVWQ